MQEGCLVPEDEIFLEPLIFSENQAGAPGFTSHATLRQQDRAATVTFKVSGCASVMSPVAGEAMVALGLLAAMKLGSRLRIAGALDRGFVSALERFQGVFSTWYPELHEVEIATNSLEESRPADVDSLGAGLFFSGGLDSIYSALKHREEITHAIFVHGLDVPLENRDYRERASESVRKTVGDLGFELVEIETDLLAFSDQFGPWGSHYHGAGLAAMAMILGGTLGKIYIAGSYSHRSTEPWGSTAWTDPLFSSAGFEVINDGGEHDRFGKTRTICAAGADLGGLRVCFENPGRALNCGRCEKCYRTMLALRICGALDRCPTFERALDLEELANSKDVRDRILNVGGWQTLWREAKRSGDSELFECLDSIVTDLRHHEAVRGITQQRDELMQSEQWKRALPKFRGAVFKSLLKEDPDWLRDQLVPEASRWREPLFDRLWRHDCRWLRCRFFSKLFRRWILRKR